MLIETTVLVLGAALLHAAWNTLVKTAADPLVSVGALSLVTAVPGLLLVLVVPIPTLTALPYLAGSVVLHFGYYLFLVSAYRVGDLSHVYPISRGSAPLLVALGGIVFAQEQLPVLTLFGIVITSIGIMLLAISGVNSKTRNHRSTPRALITGGFIAAYTLVDGLGVREGEVALSYIGWLFLINGLVFGLFVFLRRPAEMLSLWRKDTARVVGGGIAKAVAYGTVIFVMYYSPMAVVATLRETSVIMAALIGVYFLREPAGQLRIVAALLVASGVIAMNLSN
ncbi:MAG TPA: EamA family transporter [Gammaproteobacteria bacterium]|nr:EamA family transporter [Gammaproteobacteria bacterium]